MRVYISVDMEGVAGVVHEDQTDPIDPRHAGEYNRFRRLMTSEANAAVEGAFAAGATRVLVNDSHWRMRNLLAEELHPGAELLSGGPKLGSMVEGVDWGSMPRCSSAITPWPGPRTRSSTTPIPAWFTRCDSTGARPASWPSTPRSPGTTGCRWSW